MMGADDAVAAFRSELLLRMMEPDRRGRWTLLQHGEDGAAWRGPAGLHVIWSIARELDDELWLHVSVSRPGVVTTLPTYNDMKMANRTFCGDRIAYSVHAPAPEHVNIHPGVLHLWARVDGAHVLPDFTRGGATI